MKPSSTSVAAALSGAVTVDAVARAVVERLVLPPSVRVVYPLARGPGAPARLPGWEPRAGEHLDQHVLHQIHGVVVVTGDVHSSWAWEVPAAEFNKLIEEEAQAGWQLVEKFDLDESDTWYCVMVMFVVWLAAYYGLMALAAYW